jgi:maltooligosyltrehalose trehalohydrolase
MSFPSSDSATATLLRPGASVLPDGVNYCVWAPDHREVTVRVRKPDGRPAIDLPLESRGEGYFCGADPNGAAGDRYAFLLDNDAPLPDPASRFQPEGVHEWSECVDPTAYVWRTDTWQRPAWAGQSIYELHIGTFTPQGTFRAAIEKLEHLASLGVGAIELMPVADFPGRRNWGYDGVALYAPARCYGRPDDLRALVDAAHARGLAVILDVVYNHFGPDGNYLARFSRGYFHPERHTPWGQAFNLDGPNSRPVRDFFLGNAAYWFDEFRFDGLRLDATHAIPDESPRHLLAELADVAHERGAFLIAEDDRNSCDVLRRPDGGGAQIDAVWADDFHHQVRVTLTGVQEAYFKSYGGSSEEIADTLNHGWFYRGQAYPFWKGRPKGEATDHLPPHAFVFCIENHDQVGNRALGERLEHLIGPAAFRAASALLCLSPHPPMIFMGQEWSAGSPFLYFTDHGGDLGALVSEGRRKEFAAAGLNQGLKPEDVPDPQALSTFTGSKLAWDELRLSPHATVLALYRECLRHRNEWLQRVAADRACWTATAFDRIEVIRYRCMDTERLVVTSLKGDARIGLWDHPVLQPPPGCEWHLVFDSNSSWRDGEGAPPAGASVWGAVEGSTVKRLVFDAPTTVLLASQPIQNVS